MPELVGVHFDNLGKVAFLATNGQKFHIEDKVIAETERGVEVGIVRTLPENYPEIKNKSNENKIIRLATKEDIKKEKEIEQEEVEALKECRQKIVKHNLDMSLIDAQYTFDKKRITFYFLADERVDFRELVKDLASSFHTRIELRQVGVRDGAKVLGGIGVCGRQLCCATFLKDFAPVSIKMAKDQNLSLNPTKISGVCGRLMCCLTHEEECYEELNKKLPNKGDTVKTPDKEIAEVMSVDVLREKVKVILTCGETKEIREYKASELIYKTKHEKEEKIEDNTIEKKDVNVEEKEEKEEKEIKKDNKNPNKKNKNYKVKGNIKKYPKEKNKKPNKNVKK